MENKAPSPPEGLICPIVTPLRPDGSLDRASLATLIKHVDRYVDGILVGDLIWGEGLALPREMRCRLAEAALEIIRGKVPVLFAVTGTTLRETALLMGCVESFADRMEYGGALFWVDCPLLYHSNKELPQMYARLVSETRIPFILANHPGLVKARKGPARHHNIRTAVLKKTAQQEGIGGIVYHGTSKRYLNYQQAVRCRRNFVFYDADEIVFLKNPGTGGVVAGGSNLTPRQWYEIACASLDRYEGQLSSQLRRSAVWESGVMIHALHGLYHEAPAAYMKQMLCEAGVIAGSHTAASVKGTDPDQARTVTSLLKSYGIT